MSESETRCRLERRESCAQFRYPVTCADDQAAARKQRFAEGFRKNGTGASVEIDKEVAAEDQVVAWLGVESAGVCQVSSVKTNTAAQLVTHVPLLAPWRATCGLKIAGYVFERACGIDTTLSNGERRVRNIECINCVRRNGGAAQNCGQ